MTLREKTLFCAPDHQLITEYCRFHVGCEALLANRRVTIAVHRGPANLAFLIELGPSLGGTFFSTTTPEPEQGIVGAQQGHEGSIKSLFRLFFPSVQYSTPEVFFGCTGNCCRPKSDAET